MNSEQAKRPALFVDGVVKHYPNSEILEALKRQDFQPDQKERVLVGTT